MSPEKFIARWRGTTRTERSAAQEHFLDLCALLGVPKPADVDRQGTEYTFEKATRKIGDTAGFADVWKRHCFAWEYKGNRRNLVEAYAQLKQYADALENPPLLIVSDMQEIRVHTNFTNAIAQQHVIPLAELSSVEARYLLRDCFLHPERLLPTATRESVTAQAAANFANIAVLLRRHHDDRRVAHFINKLVFCLFAEDIDLLPDRVFADILDEAIKRPDDFVPMLSDLFRAMANRNGRFGMAAIPWFNGGLFDDDDVLPLGIVAVQDLMTAARLDWKAIDPTIFGTLFESGLDDKKRAEMASLFDAPDPEDRAQAQLFTAPTANRGVGIHYTDEATIMKIIEPVVVTPLRREWEQIKAEISEIEERRARARTPAEQSKLLAKARGLYGDFRASLGRYRVLDPACGSGNFLALSLRALKDFDLSVLDDGGAMGLPPDNFRVGPESVMGIEINAYAAELARLTVWITELQWQLRKGLGLTRRPILDRLDGIVRADALLTSAGNEREWPKADVVVGNPPFLGAKLMKRRLGTDYTGRLRAAYSGRLAGFSDIVCFWLERARDEISRGRVKRAGLVATSSIRGGTNRPILDRISDQLVIYNAWSELPWVIEGARVEVSIICFGSEAEALQPFQLNGEAVTRINADLTSGVDLTIAKPLPENADVSFLGIQKSGPFDIAGDLAREWLLLPINPNGTSNRDVLRPYWNGDDVTGRPRDVWFIDLPLNLAERDASLFERPFTYLEHSRYDPDSNKDLRTLREARSVARDRHARSRWWEPYWPRPEMRRRIGASRRYLVTTETSEHRLFIWLRLPIIPDKNLIVVCRDDDTAFGILHSKFHEAWALRRGTSLEDRPRYTATTTFASFPFPQGLTPNIPAAEYADDPRAVAIAEASRRLNELREAWLNPPDLVERVLEVVPGFPDRIVPVSPTAAATLKTRTLTTLYNERPAWLDNAHRDLDAVVAAAYGWPADLPEEEALSRLLALNLERSDRQ